MSAYGELHVSTAVATSIAVAGTYQKLAGTTLLDEAENVDMSVVGTLRYTGTATRPFLVEATMSLQSSVGAAVTIALAKNGTVDTESEIQITMYGASKMPVALKNLVSLAQNDRIEVWIKSDVVANITATKMKMSMVAA